MPLLLLHCRLNAGILAVGLVIYALVARTYTEKPVTSVDKVPGSAAVAASGHRDAQQRCISFLHLRHTVHSQLYD
jgi:hypothetical protein